MQIYDLTLPISEASTVWPGDPAVRMQLVSSLRAGDDANVTQLHLSVHTGTHLDAPFHFDSTGVGVDGLPLDVLIGPCRVVNFLDLKQSIDRSDLEELNLEGVKRILFKTQNSERWTHPNQAFRPNDIYLTTDGATYLQKSGVALIGIDGFSIEKFENPGHPTHRLLLKNQVIILEGLNLNEVPAGDYELIALPLKLKGADGAPTRVVLREYVVS